MCDFEGEGEGLGYGSRVRIRKDLVFGMVYGYDRIMVSVRVWG